MLLLIVREEVKNYSKYFILFSTFYNMNETCIRCHALTSSGGQCKMRTCRQYPYCWMHMKMIYGVQVKNSEISNAGKGLFATKSVKKNKTITHYSSKEVSNQVDKNSKYVLQLGPRRFLDSQNKLNHNSFSIKESKEIKDNLFSKKKSCKAKIEA